MFKHIVWATDGSEHADRAFDYATQIAHREGAPLHVVHVIEKLTGPRVAGQNVFLGEHEIDAKIRRQVADVAGSSGVNATLYMCAASPQNVAEQVSKAAEEHEADLIVVGTRGHSAIAGVLLGSVTQRLLHLAHCPILAVPPATAAPTNEEPAATLTTTG